MEAGCYKHTVQDRWKCSNNGYIDKPSRRMLACRGSMLYRRKLRVHPVKVGKLPTAGSPEFIQCQPAALCYWEQRVTKDRQKIYQAPMMDLHTGAELNIKDIQ